MFAIKTQDPASVSAINVNKFDFITVRRTNSGYALSVHNVPIQGDAFHDIETFSDERQAVRAFESLMSAIAHNEPCWPIDFSHPIKYP